MNDKPSTATQADEPAKGPLAQVTWLAEWEAERDRVKKCADDHAAYGGMLYAEYMGRWKAIHEMLESWRYHSANDEALPRRGAPLAAARGSTSEKRVKQKK